MKKTTKLLGLMILMVSIFLVGCGEPKVSLLEQATNYYDFYGRCDASRLSEMGNIEVDGVKYTVEEGQKDVDEYILSTIEELEDYTDCTATPEMIENFQNSYIEVVKKVEAKIEVVSEDKEEGTVKYTLNPIDTDDMFEMFFEKMETAVTDNPELLEGNDDLLMQKTFDSFIESMNEANRDEQVEITVAFELEGGCWYTKTSSEAGKLDNCVFTVE